MAASTKPFSVKLHIEAAPFYRYIDDLNARQNLTALRAILRNTATKIIVPPLRSAVDNYLASPAKGPIKRTGRFRASMGNITGGRKTKSVAIMFAGPRMETGGQRRMGFQGWVANILQNWKDPKKKRIDLKSVHHRVISKVQDDIARSVERLVRKRWK